MLLSQTPLKSRPMSQVLTQQHRLTKSPNLILNHRKSRPQTYQHSHRLKRSRFRVLTLKCRLWHHSSLLKVRLRWFMRRPRLRFKLTLLTRTWKLSTSLRLIQNHKRSILKKHDPFTTHYPFPTTACKSRTITLTVRPTIPSLTSQSR